MAQWRVEFFIGATVEADDPICYRATRREHEDGYIHAPAQPLADLQAVHPRHRQIQHHQVECGVACELQRLLPTSGDLDIVALEAQPAPEDAAYLWVVVDDQNCCHMRTSSGVSIAY